MRDKDIVALITAIAFLLYFFPSTVLRFLSLGIVLFFSPGFFLLKILYRDMELEELLLLSVGVSVAVSGAIALLLAFASRLSPPAVFGTVALLCILGYFLSSAIEIETRKISRPDRFTAVMLAMMLVLIGIWVGVESQTSYYREVDIAINHWPQNGTVNSTLEFEIYVKNQNYGNAECSVVFSLNGERIDEKHTVLNSGEHATFIFHGASNRTGKNLASFDLLVNGKMYTNVHVYFYLH